MGIAGAQAEELQRALLEAFPTDPALTALALFELDENLDVVTTTKATLGQRALELIRWADAHGRLDDLVRGARRQNAGNERLRLLAERWVFAAAAGAADPANLPRGVKIGERDAYTVESLLGRGAMGAVYRVRDKADRPRALKVLYGRAMRDRGAVSRLAKEARVGGTFSDEAREHVVDVFDVGFDPRVGPEGSAFLAMELLKGETLGDRVERQGGMAPSVVLARVEELALVLDEAAAAKEPIVHCDLKPENLFVVTRKGGEMLKVLDFGIAQTLRERTVGQLFRLTGTPLFAAPEQWRPDADVSPATDRWAMGLVVFHALTGGHFWKSALLPGLVEEVHLRPYPSASERAAELGVALPRGFDAWFARCVNPKPEARFASAAEALRALREEVAWAGDGTAPLAAAGAAGAAPREERAVLPPEFRAPAAREDPGEGLDERLADTGPMTLQEVVAMLRAMEPWLAKHRALGVRAPLEPSRVRFVTVDGREEVRVLGLDAMAVADTRAGQGRTRTQVMAADVVGYVPSRLRAEGGYDDLWAVARVAFFALTGVRYVKDGDVAEVLLRADVTVAPSERLEQAAMVGTVKRRPPAGFDEWFRRCTAAEGRFASVGEAAEALGALGVGLTEQPPPPRTKLPVVMGAADETKGDPRPEPKTPQGPVVPRGPQPEYVDVVPGPGSGRVWLVLAVVALAFALWKRGVAPAARDAGVAGGDVSRIEQDASPDAPPVGAVTFACPEGMALIPAGEFRMGSPDGQGESDERPQHTVRFREAFCMDRTEVSVAAYRACVQAGRHCTEPNPFRDRRGEGSVFCNWGRPGADEDPVNCVDWNQAKRFCEWTGHVGGARRLPREAEWEYAARGSANRAYPWGDATPDGTRTNLCGEECVRYARERGHRDWTQIANWRDEYGATAPVTAFPSGATPEGLLNMGGNVWEWVEDVYAADAYARHDAEGFFAREATDASQTTEYRVFRGGGWSGVVASGVRAADRGRVGPTYRGSDVGFRCARGVASNSVDP